jgi:tetraacyldisaccharide 4'-kinase
LRIRGSGQSARIETSGYLALIRGERRGLLASLARGFLWLCSWLFCLIAWLRGKLYDWGLLRQHSAGAKVISVGNLTTGGTGKTPLVIALCRELMERGESVAVLARGYGAPADGELNDELRMIESALPGVALHPGKDRVARAREAVEAGATCLVLDDGFQHRRLARDLDVVLLDATDPWGTGHLLPRGLLREPRRALARGDVLVLSRAELKGGAELAALEEAARSAGFSGPTLRMFVQPAHLERLHPDPAPLELSELSGQGVLLACGIGNPNAFAATVATLGARTSQLFPFPDHHAYDVEDVYALEELASRRAVRHVLITSKDAVKLRPLLADAELTWLCLGIEARLEPDDAMQQLLPFLPEVS